MCRILSPKFGPLKVTAKIISFVKISVEIFRKYIMLLVAAEMSLNVGTNMTEIQIQIQRNAILTFSAFLSLNHQRFLKENPFLF